LPRYCQELPRTLSIADPSWQQHFPIFGKLFLIWHFLAFFLAAHYCYFWFIYIDNKEDTKPLLTRKKYRKMQGLFDFHPCQEGGALCLLLSFLSWHEADFRSETKKIANGFCERCFVPRHDRRPKTTRSKTQNKLYSDPGLFYVLQ